MRKLGKITKRNIEANHKLKELFESKGITRCEVMLEGCMGNQFLSFAHRKKRRFYRLCPDKLSDFNEVILACIPCHQLIENDKMLSSKIFRRLRANKTI